MKPVRYGWPRSRVFPIPTAGQVRGENIGCADNCEDSAKRGIAESRRLRGCMLTILYLDIPWSPRNSIVRSVDPVSYFKRTGLHVCGLNNFSEDAYTFQSSTCSMD